MPEIASPNSNTTGDGTPIAGQLPEQYDRLAVADQRSE
jgi:hypothetical protein